jgi:hypothetical protein
MREDILTPATARRIQRAGLPWDPQLGDWCLMLGGEVVAEAQAGLWLVAALAPTAGLVGLMDAAGQWPMTRVAVHDCVWLPTAGKLKMWLRARGYRVATGETDPTTLGAGPRHVCKITRAPDEQPIRGEGPNEAEAVAEVVLAILAESARTGQTPTLDQAAVDRWIAVPELPTRRL